jgi:ABC-2 type transport system permease protein
MRAEVARLDISSRTRSMTGYSLGLAIYCLVVVAIYPAFEHSTSLDKLISNDATAAALFGISGKISTPGGWLNANIYANFFPLIMLLLTIGYGAACLAGQDEDGTLGLVVTLPLPRRSIVLQKVAAMALQAAAPALVVAVFVLVGRSFHLIVSVGQLSSVSLSVLLMALDFGFFAMTVGAFTGRRGTAIGAGATLAAASYLVSSLAPVASWIAPARYASLFYWSVGRDQISSGVSVGDFTVLVVVGLLASFASVISFRRLDVR